MLNNVKSDEPIWVERYRPQTIEECILPENLKTTFQKFVDDQTIPNLILAGPAGIGKTTVAKAMLKQLGCDYIVINGSLNGNIDTLRYTIMNFASTVSFQGGRKYVIIDEADGVNPNSTQPALRNFMEEFSKNCGFILTCNFKNKIIEPLHSRCSVIDFNITNSEKPKLATQFFKRAIAILKNEGVEYENAAVASIVQTFFPDWRRVINELQTASSRGSITENNTALKSGKQIEELMGLLKAKNFTSIRKWVVDNNDIDSVTLYKELFEILPYKLANTSSVADSIIILAEYQYKEAFVANSEINRLAALLTIMVECEWK